MEENLHSSTLPRENLRKLAREEVQIIGGILIGLAALYLSSLLHNPSAGAPGWGYPFVWHVIGTGPKVPESFFGLYLGVVNWVAFALDLVFWMALSLAVIEISSHIGLPYFKKRRRIHRSKHDALPSSAPM